MIAENVRDRELRSALNHLRMKRPGNGSLKVGRRLEM
jgi:hypothetical protein